MKWFFALMISTMLFSGIVTISTQDSFANHPTYEVALEEQSKIVIENDVPYLCKDEQGNAKACSNEDVLLKLSESFGGLQGATALTVAYFVVNLIMYFLYSPIGNTLLPKKFESSGYKLILAVLLYLISGVVGLMLPPTSLPFFGALTHSASLAAFGVLANQIFKKYAKSKIDNAVITA